MPNLNIDVRSNIASLSTRLDEYAQKKIPFATVFALTKTAQDVRAEEYKKMAAVFDRPTPFTLNSLAVQPATKQLPVAKVNFKEGFGSVPAYRYLGPEIESGGRSKKSYEVSLERAGILKSDEFTVPGEGVQLDQYGNMRGSQLTQILSQLRATSDAGQWATRSRRSRRSVARAGQYFVSRGVGRLPDGIYRRQGRSTLPILLFVRAPHYAKRLPFIETADQTFAERFDEHFQEGILRYGIPGPPPSVK